MPDFLREWSAAERLVESSRDAEASRRVRALVERCLWEAHVCLKSIGD
jgi:hypothetical protein